MAEPESIEPSEIQTGRIRHGSLSPEILERIDAVYEVIGQYLGKTLEQFEVSFMRDSDPATEVIVWCSITAAWLDYHQKYLNEEILPDEAEEKLISALILISSGLEDVSKFGVPADVGQRLLGCYDGLSEM